MTTTIENARHRAFEALQEHAGPILPEELRQQVEISNQLCAA